MALRMMNVGYEDMLDTMSLEDLMANEAYAVYLNGMEDSINRALLRLADAGVLATEREEVPETRLVRERECIRIEEVAAPVDKRLVRLARYEGGHYYPYTPYLCEGTTVVVPFVCGAESRFVLVWQQEIPWVGPTTPDEVELPIGRDIATLIPYFVKSELYAEENPVAARDARELFEQALFRLERGEQASVLFWSKYCL